MRFLHFVLGRSGDARVQLVLAAVLGAASGLASVGLLSLIGHSLGEGVDSRQLGVLFIALCVALTLARLGSQYFLTRLGQGMARELRLRLTRQILTAPLHRLEELGSHRLLAILSEDIGALTIALVFVPVIFINGTIVVGCLIYLAWLEPRLFLLLLAALSVGAVTYQLPARFGLRRFRESRREEDVLFGHFRGLSEGIKELKLHRERRTAFGEMVKRTADEIHRLRLAASVSYGFAAAWGHLLFLVSIGVLLYARPDWLAADRSALIGYTVVLLYMIGPLHSLLDSTPNFGRANVAVERVMQLQLSLEPEAAAGSPVAPQAAPGWSLLKLAGVSHTYRREGQDGSFTLGPLDFSLRPGELVFLVGGNGSGKTTLAKLLVGLYPPQTGEVLLDGSPITEEDRDGYRQLFSVVFADFYLFDRLLGIAAPDLDAEARRLLEELRIAHKVRIEDGRLSTTDLSLGQRKRLALLTAYLEDRPIYVFDEWAADQDPVFKEVFYREILAELKRRGKAVVAISHDDRYFHLADRIVALDEGLVRSGTAASSASAAPVAAAR